MVFVFLASVTQSYESCNDTVMETHQVWMQCNLCKQSLILSMTTKTQINMQITAKYTKDTFHRILFGGDQLTTAQAIGSQQIRQNSNRAKERLEGVIPVTEDWHAKKCLLSVSDIMHTYTIYVYSNNVLF